MLMQLTSCIVLASLAQASAQNKVDPFMGDWKGRLDLGGGAPEDIAVYMIPRGGGNYEMMVTSAFNKRVPVRHHLRGRFKPGEFKMADAVPFDPDHIIGATGRGVVVDASLWTGKPSNDSLRCEIAGKVKGSAALKRAPRSSPTLGAKPPKDAVILFDGGNLDAWTSANPKIKTVQWEVLDSGAMEVRRGDIKTKEQFTDHKLHLEFCLPYMPHARGQGRANSGVYLQGRYEVQILDSYGLDGRDNECGGLYKVSAPSVNMCFPPLHWQTFDITFHAPDFDSSGKKTKNARITVVHNGVTIQDDVELPEVTGGAIDKKVREPGPLKLQDHGNPLQFRNIWAVPLR